MPIGFVTIPKFAADSGYTKGAIRTKIRDGVWREGEVWVKAPDGRVLISVEGYNEWVASGSTTAFGRLRPAASRPTSTKRATGAASGSGLSPPPLSEK